MIQSIKSTGRRNAYDKEHCPGIGSADIVLGELKVFLKLRSPELRRQIDSLPEITNRRLRSSETKRVFAEIRRIIPNINDFSGNTIAELLKTDSGNVRTWLKANNSNGVVT